MDSINQLTNPQFGGPGVSRVTRNKVQSSNFRMAKLLAGIREDPCQLHFHALELLKHNSYNTKGPWLQKFKVQNYCYSKRGSVGYWKRGISSGQPYVVLHAQTHPWRVSSIEGV